MQPASVRTTVHKISRDYFLRFVLYAAVYVYAVACSAAGDYGRGKSLHSTGGVPSARTTTFAVSRVRLTRNAAGQRRQRIFFFLIIKEQNYGEFCYTDRAKKMYTFMCRKKKKYWNRAKECNNAKLRKKNTIVVVFYIYNRFRQKKKQQQNHHHRVILSEMINTTTTFAFFYGCAGV